MINSKKDGEHIRTEEEKLQTVGGPEIATFSLNPSLICSPKSGRPENHAHFETNNLQ